MKEHPILFKTEMVQAILNGHKSQTRRIITPQNSIVGEGKVDWNDFCWDGTEVYKDTCQHGHTEIHKAPLPFADGIKLHVPYKYSEDCTIYRIYPKWDIGDRLWVKESALYPPDITEQMIIEGADTWPKVVYSAGNINIDELKGWGWKRKPSIFMPRWASRITLEITDIRVQKLHEIGQLTHDDCAKEGWPFGYNPDFLQEHPLATFRRYWNSINEERGYGWDKNPWVWVISFKVIK